MPLQSYDGITTLFFKSPSVQYPMLYLIISFLVIFLDLRYLSACLYSNSFIGSLIGLNSLGNLTIFRSSGSSSNEITKSVIDLLENDF